MITGLASSIEASGRDGGTFTLTRPDAPPLTGLTPAQVLTHFGAA